MNAIQGTIERLKRIQLQARDIAIEVIEEDPKFLARLNKEQLRRGETATGDNMPPYAANSSAPKAPGNIQLLDTGDWQEGIRPVFDDQGINMTSDDFKTVFLDPKYPHALGVNQSAKLIIAKKRPIIIKRLKRL